MSIPVNIQGQCGSLSTTQYDVVVVGAGPYGLSTAAHLAGKGLKVAIFGKPLQLWRDFMPGGMLLRSYWWASNLSDPQKKYGMRQYFEAHRQEALYPLPIETFIDYGLWFQRQAVPEVDETFVASINYTHEAFELMLVDGRLIKSRSVVMALGLHYYAHRPLEYAHLPDELVSHSSQYAKCDNVAGKKIVIVGGGQSALELAALLHENGALVDVVTHHAIHWLGEEALETRSVWQRLRSPVAGIAPGWFNWSLEHIPYGFQCLSRETKDRLLRGRGRYGPAGSAWLKPRILGRVALHEALSVKEAHAVNTGVLLTLSNERVIYADQVILATGYRVDVWNLPMLQPALVSRIRTYNHAPLLNSSFESSVPGCYFVGISAVASFGPFYRFVVGTEAAARRVSDAIAHRVVSVR